MQLLSVQAYSSCKIVIGKYILSQEKKVFLQCVLLPLRKTIFLRDNTFFFLPFKIIFDVTIFLLFVYLFSDTSSSENGWCISIG